jgi:sugar phosphate isomerase/epimerase
MMRANTNVPVKGRAFDVPLIASSFRRLAEYGRAIGVTILVENHYGSTVIKDAASVVNAVNDPNCRAALDWGNTPGKSTESRIADYSQMFQKLALVSAKGLHFDSTGRHVEYDLAQITRAIEKSGYQGVYSIELYVDADPPRDPVGAVHSMIEAIAPAIVNKAARLHLPKETA